MKKVVRLFFSMMPFLGFSQLDTYDIHTIAFYNVENLYDTIDDLNTFDEDFTPEGKLKFSGKDYDKKMKNIAQVISEIGYNQAPVLVGLAEIENSAVLQDLVNTSFLSPFQYGFIQFDSPDLRGIDVALLYQKKKFKPIFQEAIEVKIWDESGMRIFTRDILYISGILADEEIHVFVNHWPSRRGGEEISESKRIKAAYVLKRKIEEIQSDNVDAKIIVLGDFNDNPTDEGIKEVLASKGSMQEVELDEFFNPFEKMYKIGYNTLAHWDQLHLFDQVLVSKSFLPLKKNKNQLFFLKANIYNPPYISNLSGKYKGYPKRSFINNKFANGYSDHYPVYISLLKRKTL
ncbi:endonuclease/exonuclease/phosphatase family protein [Namhaeicola litoreus]|uniref:Endonuclease/exonuclease/phosphatase family protein n=1 Tax=Namhaeicola litoreus TaxID=1052145 RepID=A0ABW3Y2P3_9FLAO